MNKTYTYMKALKYSRNITYTEFCINYVASLNSRAQSSMLKITFHYQQCILYTHISTYAKKLNLKD